MRLILYSQPFRSLFCKVQDLDTQHFQLACPLAQCGDLMWYCNVGEVHIDDLYNLVIVVADALKLEIKVVKSGDELRLRRFRKFSNFSLRRWASRLSFAGSFICFGIPESRTNGEFAAELRHRTVDRNTAPDGNLPDFTILLLGAHAENKIKYLETRYLLFFALPVTYNSPAVKRPGCCDFKLHPSWGPLREPAEEWVFRSCPHCFHNARYSPAANATAVWRVRA